MSAQFLTICLNPVLQKTLQLASLKKEAVNRTDNYRTDASGKGVNVSRVLTQLGGDVTHLTHVGGYEKKRFLELLAKDNIKIRTVDSKSEIRTCYTLLDSKKHSTTEIVEEAHCVNSKCEDKILKLFRKILPKYDAVIISGTKAKGYSSKIIPTMVKESKALNKVVILDIKGDDLIQSLEFRPDIIKPNLEELTATFESIDVKKKIVEWGELGITAIITDGIKPTRFWNGKEVELRKVTTVKQPLNTTGCGDAFTAGLAYATMSGLSIQDSIYEGETCGKLNAEKLIPGVIK